MTKLLVLLAALSLACDSDGPCDPRHGLYMYRLTPTGTTTCPPIPDTVFNADAPASTADCGGGVVNTPDMCEVTVDLACPVSSGGALVTRGKVTWSTDGSSGSGTLYLELRDGSNRISCAGTYAATYTRL